MPSQTPHALVAHWVVVTWCLSGVALAADDVGFFENSVRPLLVERCETCHSAAQGKTSGGLALDTRGGWRAGGDSGSPVVPGKPEESLLVRRIRSDDDGERMPPKEGGKRLTEAEVAVLVEWVRRGAIDPRTAAPRIGGMTPDEARNWWAFRPLARVEPPEPKGWVRGGSAIDRFLRVDREKRGIAPAPPADRRTLIRRATFDLTGLPPAPDEVEAFVADEGDGAFARVVDRLLASPAYGQRWARHWLDVARYADFHDPNPKARTASCEITEAWRYRDWVVDAFNADLPFDRFIVHQIAGDLLPDPDGGDHYAGGLVATTFLSNGVWDRGDADKEKIVSDMVDDNIDVVGKSFLGLTLGCARCHDHKFDPVTTEDYYALAGIFYSSHILKELGTKGGEYTVNRVPLAPAAFVAQRNAQLAKLAEMTSKLDALDKQSPRPPANDPERVRLVAERDRIQSELRPEPPLAMAVQEGGTPGGLFPGIQDVPVHVRGSYARLGPVVPRGLPRFFAGVRPPIISGSGRRELAAWVASPENPLTPRVIVNRVWQWHFGEGLSRTPGNFGKLGEPPSHPELLDWLAARLLEDGWSLKALHRRILLSAAYQQSNRGGDGAERDPENRWLGRFAARRLEAEALRDAMLCVSGRLDPTFGGPAGDDFTIARRSLYVQTARWDRASYAMLFDAANPDASTDRRTTSTVAPQALLLLNHPFVLAQAGSLAERLAQEAPDFDTRIDRGYRLLFSRPASAREIEIARELIAAGGESGWIDWAHVLLCSSEFAYVD